jgi:prepilin-type N-terminal cleavage/methylation domain-containing protein
VSLRIRDLRRAEAGLTLIEVLVALTLFAIITVGIIPLLASALRGVATTRSVTVGKTVASAAMEKMRGLPYFESSEGQPTPVRTDLLDLYFPDLGTGYDSTAQTFTTTCTPTSSAPAASGGAACPPNIPAGYTVTFVAAFVNPGPASPTPQTFTVLPPSPGYTWTTATEPPAKLLRVTVTTNWTFGGRARTFSLSSLLGQRHLSKQTIDANANVDHGVQVLSSYVDSLGRRSNLVATIGQGAIDVLAGAGGKADENTRAAQVVLTQEETATEAAVTLANVAGASSTVHAPPNSYPAPSASVGEKTVPYKVSDLETIPIAFIDDTVVEPPTPFSLGGQIISELPVAAGRFRFSGAAGAGQPTMWVDNQAQRGLTSPLKLHDSAHLVTVEKDGATPRLNGQVTAEGTALSPPASRKVETKASVQLAKLSIFPTTFITDPENAVLLITDFTASLACKSTANTSTASVTGTWSATLRYWQDPNNNGLPIGAGYSAPVTLSGSLTGGVDPMTAIKAANPLVYDDLVDANDVYLFKAGGRNGYFSDIRTNPLVSSVVGSGGRSTFGSINGAIEITTAPTSTTLPSSTMSVSVGSLSCDAVDRRGL